MTSPRIGLLPLYLELYDSVVPDARVGMEAFYSTIVKELEERGLEVITSDICRVKDEFDSAISAFEDAKVDAVVTLHLAYSPSLEVVDALAKTKLPVIVLDTTPDYPYSPQQDPGAMLFNHGIHGVQDMCNMLIRRGKAFQIEAGHWEKSDVLDRVCACARAAKMAANMRSARVGRIGEPFKGMGDFAVENGVLREIGVETVVCDFAELRELLPKGCDASVVVEMAFDMERFAAVNLDADAHIYTTQACLAVRCWIEKENLTAFTMNFESIDRRSGIPTVPFLEASKAMAHGIGYAGEGDVLTAALVGALASVYPETSFTEMFCPDWENDAIFLSHMGEMNVDLAVDRAVLMNKPLPWLDADSPVIAVGRFRGGEAVLVNLAPGVDDTFTLILAPAVMQDVEGEDRMGDMVRGWFKPSMAVSEFLEEYSRIGGTHHAALVYGDVVDELIRFGEMMGWGVEVLV